MDSDIENLNSRLRALILKERKKYAVELLNNIEHTLLHVLSEEEATTYMENARKIVFKNDLI